MSYQLLLTNTGAAKIATASNAGGTSLHITDFAVGQGVNVDFSTRLDKQTLVAKRYQGKVESVNLVAPNKYEIVCVVPVDVGGFTIREMGLIDSDGVLVWVGGLPEVQKPEATSTAAVDYRLKAVVQVDNPAVSIVVDANAVTATQSWVNNTISKAFTDFQALFETWKNSVNQDIELVKSRRPVSVGGLLVTTNNYADSEAVRAGEGYGVWTRYAEGRVLIGVGTAKDINAQSKTFTLGQIGGEYSHTLTEAEMPAHSHNVLLADGVTSGENQSISAGGGSVGQYGTDTSSVKDAGGSKPHNNIQPFVAVGIWLRLPDNYVAPTFSTYWTTDEAGINKVTGFGETDNIYLWIEAGNITGSLPVIHSYATTIDRGGVDQLDDINSTIPAPSSIKNGKNLVFAATTDSYSISDDVTLSFDITISDAFGATEYTVTSSTSVANTVIDTPPDPVEPTPTSYAGSYSVAFTQVYTDNDNPVYSGFDCHLTHLNGDFIPQEVGHDAYLWGYDVVYFSLPNYVTDASKITVTLSGENYPDSYSIDYAAKKIRFACTDTSRKQKPADSALIEYHS